MVSVTVTPAPTDASCTVPGAESEMVGVPPIELLDPAPNPATQAAASFGRSPLTKSYVAVPFDQMLTWSTVTPSASTPAMVEASQAGKTASSWPDVAPVSSMPNGLLCSLANATVSANDQP